MYTYKRQVLLGRLKGILGSQRASKRLPLDLMKRDLKSMHVFILREKIEGLR